MRRTFAINIEPTISDSSATTRKCYKNLKADTDNNENVHQCQHRLQAKGCLLHAKHDTPEVEASLWVFLAELSQYFDHRLYDAQRITIRMSEFLCRPIRISFRICLCK